MKYSPKCFISYAHSDREFVKEEIVPMLSEIGLDVWIDYEKIEAGWFIADTILKGIRQADVVIAILNRRSTYVNFEIGAAIGQNKPIFAIIGEYQEIPFDLKNINYFHYAAEDKSLFIGKLRDAITIVADNVINKSIYELADNKKIIGISVGLDKLDFEQELRFTADFFSLIKKITGSKEISLVQAKKGSFESFLSIDLKSCVDLVEKILFFVPEWQKKKAEVLKIHAETLKTLAETERIKAETNHINTQARMAEGKALMEQADDMADLMLKYKELGLKIQIDSDLLLTLNPNGVIVIKEPEKLE